MHNGQLEFINGGWCMHDEASPYEPPPPPLPLLSSPATAARLRRRRRLLPLPTEFVLSVARLWRGGVGRSQLGSGGSGRYYVEMVDQTTRGHQFLKKNFGDAAIPRGTWQIDPFGHSNTQARHPCLPSPAPHRTSTAFPATYARASCDMLCDPHAFPRSV